MTDLNGIINGINQATQVIGAVNGAVNTLAPALQQIEGTVNNVAGSVNGMMGYPPNGYPQDMYAPPGYYPPQGQVPAMMQTTSDGSGLATLSSGISGATVGALLSTKTAASIKSQSVNSSVATEGIADKLGNMSQGSQVALKNAGKAAGIGAIIGGTFSGIQNFMKMSRGEITGAEATGHIVADTTVGMFAATGGFATGTMAAMALGGIGGVPGIIGAAVAGLVGGVGTDFLMRKTGIRDAISNGVRKILG
ncbi:MAG: hypothetical protein U0457_21725 [Candidatus Sericytochromatia bacterium]